MMEFFITIGEDVLYGVIALMVGYLFGYLHRDIVGKED